HNPESTRIPWHTAFIEALQQELSQYSHILTFIPEFQLTAEPLRIDVIIIKKTQDTPITKNIAASFRSVNLVEYKSPADYGTVEDFYKVYGYACLYASLHKVPVTELTLSFVESRYPRDVLGHFKEIRGYTVEERNRGIYTVVGDIIPIQIIDSRELEEEESIWLKGLDWGLGAEEIERIAEEIGKLGKGAKIGAYADAVIRANTEGLKEVIGMRRRRSKLTLEQVLEETGLIAEWKAEGKLEVAGI
ncbi:MAG: hypothetical protein LBG22_04415, partial [Treponema sp.]|nr:hypothetical protein [Treponema sp.]